ncbi:hypothetical protein Tco_1165568 [Tanacetum coccineum]
MANLTDMLSKFVTANTASTSGSGTLPGNTVTNPKEDLKETPPQIKAIPDSSENERSSNSSVMPRRGLVREERDFLRRIWHKINACTKIGQGVACINPREFTRNEKSARVSKFLCIVSFVTSGSRSTTLGEEVERIEGPLLGNLPSIHLEFEELELDRRELDKADYRMNRVDEQLIQSMNVGQCPEEDFNKLVPPKLHKTKWGMRNLLGISEELLVLNEVKQTVLKLKVVRGDFGPQKTMANPRNTAVGAQATRA